jgi:hypothetical protein
MSAPNLHIRNQAYLQKVNIQQGKGSLEGQKLSEAFDDVSSAIGNVHNQLASNPEGINVVPPKIGTVQAQHLGAGMLNFAITDNGKIQRAIDYFVEIADNPGFSGAEVIHSSPSRNGHVPVPNGTWYVKAYSQYKFGGTPSQPLTTGPINVSGSQYGTRLPTQGCGTGTPGATGQGAGTVISR